MSIRVVPENVLIEDDHSIKKSQLKKMIKGYKDHPKGGKDDSGHQRELTRFAHFPVKQVLQLFVDNNIISPDDTVATLLANTTNGMKIYYSQHMDKNDCPADVKNYKGCNTLVLVNTVLNSSNQLWDDMLDEDTMSAAKAAIGFIETTGFMDSGGGSDRTQLCPPQCALFGNTL